MADRISLYNRYRPTRWEDFIGNDEVKKSLRAMLIDGNHHSFLITGPFGSGKTTLARLIALSLEADPEWGMQEMNAANDRGIDSIRELLKTLATSPLGGGPKVIIFDEAHRLTKDAFEALLKPSEESPGHVYFVFCTTEPGKINAGIKSRCATFPLVSLRPHELNKLLGYINEQEGFCLPMSVIKRISEQALGSARTAITLLEQVGRLEVEEAEAFLNKLEGPAAEVRTICQFLLRPDLKEWGNISKIIYNLPNDPEGVRAMIIAYMGKVLAGSEMDSVKMVRAMKTILDFQSFPLMYNMGSVLFCVNLAMRDA